MPLQRVAIAPVCSHSTICGLCSTSSRLSWEGQSGCTLEHRCPLYYMQLLGARHAKRENGDYHRNRTHWTQVPQTLHCDSSRLRVDSVAGINSKEAAHHGPVDALPQHAANYGKPRCDRSWVNCIKEEGGIITENGTNTHTSTWHTRAHCQ